MSQPFRLQPERCPLARIDRAKTLRFSFDGRQYEGCAGDTLASALIANGVSLVARSYKYHRPRGIASAGVDEPNALVRLQRGARAEPNTRTTTTELFDGLEATSQNRWPSLAIDLASVSGLFARFMPAGFYYKTFMWPASPKAWLRYERWIRRAAGLGVVPDGPDPDRYEKMHAHCDVLVVGAGPAGLAAASAAGRCGARVILVDEGSEPGGSLLGRRAEIDGAPAATWAARTLAQLESMADVAVLARTTAFGHYDQNLVGLLERVTDHIGSPPAHLPRQRYWQVRAREVVLASGAHERPLVFAGNDLPGVMLAGAAATYVERYAAAPGRRCVVFVDNDRGWRSALAVADAGIEIAAIVDSRSDANPALVAEARRRSLTVLPGHEVVRARGRARVERVEVMPIGAHPGAPVSRFDCDALLTSGGFSPVVHLLSQAQGTLRFDERLAAFVPDGVPRAMRVAGSANGEAGLAECLAAGHDAGRAAAATCGFAADPGPAPRAPAGEHAEDRDCAAPRATPATRGGKRFVDFQNDVTADDVALAQRENYASVEHLKRYTALGMGTDQGKSSNVVGLALLAAARGEPIGNVGTTTFRPPYAPVTLGALAGPERGAHVEPTRFTPMHAWHAAHGARFANAGLWQRAQMYPRRGESDLDCVNREATTVRSAVGLVDVSTLGKIEIGGRDAAEFLDRVYVNRFDSLAVGRSRYGIMLREDGFVFDDGTVSRLSARHYMMTTTTANAVRVLQHLEQLAQVVWPELDVRMASVTEQWAAAALAGPRARRVLERVADVDVANAAFPFLAVADCRIAGIAARLLRVSYSGELAYEIYVPADFGQAMWEAVLEAGRDLGIDAYGTEAMGVLRIEKGHIVIGPEVDGRTTADDLGLGRMVASKDCIGRRAAQRPALCAADRWQLVGLTSVEPQREIPRGAKLVADAKAKPPVAMLGHVTSSCYSPHLGAWIALALLERGRSRHREVLAASSPVAGSSVAVRVGPSCFLDPVGERLRG